MMRMGEERGPTGACFEESRVGNPTRGLRKYLFWLVLEPESSLGWGV